jgi:hypothetical protein
MKWDSFFVKTCGELFTYKENNGFNWIETVET